MFIHAGSERGHFISELRQRSGVAFGELADAAGERLRDAVQLALHGGGNRCQPTEHLTFDGRVSYRTNSYTEIATGLHYFKDGQWTDTREEIEIFAEGAVARQGPHQVIFAPNVRTAGAIDLLSVDGQRFRSHVLGIAYTDTATGDSVMIAEIKDAVGELIAPNQVLYSDAFTDLLGDVHYVYTRAGLEQNIILLESPPSPLLFGLNPETTQLEAYTEFVEFGAPIKSVTVLAHEPELVDEFLDFGGSFMGQGLAFPVGDGTLSDEIPTGKSWEMREGRQLLIEKVNYTVIKPFLDALPPAAAVGRDPKELMARVRKPQAGRKELARLFPVVPPRVRDHVQFKSIETAKLMPKKKGFVLDYLHLSVSLTNFTFKGDTTYFVSNATVTLAGTTTIEGGTVIKYSPTSAVNRLLFNGPIDCRTAPWRPAFFVAKDDNTVGEVISGSTGTPATNYAARALDLAFTGTTYKLHDLRFRHADRPIYISGSVILELSHSQIGFSEYGVRSGASTSTNILRNVLIYDVKNAIYTIGGERNSWEHVTVHRVTNFRVGNSNVVFLTNSLLIAVTNGATSANYVGGSDVKVSASDTGIFQTVGAGARYLAQSSPYRGNGVASINSTLLKELKQRTTWPPSLVLNNTNILTELNLGYRAPRDTGALPDIGYHYDALDAVFRRVTLTNATLKLHPGAVLGTYGSSAEQGLLLKDRASSIGQGSPTNVCRIVRYNLVQEQATTNWSAASVGHSIAIPTNYTFSVSPTVDVRFVEWSMPAAGREHFYGAYSTTPAFRFRDCQFLGGDFYSELPPVYLTNCLFDRSGSYFYSSTSACHNVTFAGGLMSVDGLFGQHFFKDNVFDQTTIDQNATNNVTANYNGYASSANRISPNGANDVLLTSTNVPFQTGALGRFYLLTNSPFRNTGSVASAASVGLWHFTTLTNQIRETNTVLDLGFHYVALGTSGLLLDTDNDGLADVIEDVNGNGSAQASEWSFTDADTFEGNGLSDLQEYELSFNVLVNDPAQDYGNEQNTQDETTTVAFGNTVVVAYVDSNLGQAGYGQIDTSCDFPTVCNMPTNPAPQFIGWAVSTDFGRSFTDKGVPPVTTNVISGLTNIFANAGDPVLGWDTNLGVIYLVGNPKRPALYYTNGVGSPTNIYLPLWRSLNRGQSFENPITAVPGLAAATADSYADKPALVVDNLQGQGQGKVYLGFHAHVAGGGSGVFIYRSSAGGTNWIKAKEYVVGSSHVALAVGANHDVYVVWRKPEQGLTTFNFSKSTDGGTNFTTPSGAFLTNTQAAGTILLTRSTNSPDVFRAPILPNLVANPVITNHLYIVYHDSSAGGTDLANIYFIQSTNGGTIWSSPIKINNDSTTNHQWQPSITVKPDGTKLFIAWYDRRNDLGSNSLIQMYGSFANLPVTSTNAFATNFLISTVKFPPVFTGNNTNAGTYDLAYPPAFAGDDPKCCGSFLGTTRNHMGDYDTAVSDNKYIYYPWADKRGFTAGTLVQRHNGDVRFVRLSWPN